MGRTLALSTQGTSAGLGTFVAIPLGTDALMEELFAFCRSPVFNFEACGLWEMLAQTLSRLSPTQAGPLALGTLKLQHWYEWGC